MYYYYYFFFLDYINEEQCSSICLMKIHIHIASITKNIYNVLSDVKDINLLPKNITLEIMNKLNNTEFKYVKNVLKL